MQITGLVAVESKGMGDSSSSSSGTAQLAPRSAKQMLKLMQLKRSQQYVQVVCSSMYSKRYHKRLCTAQ